MIIYHPSFLTSYYYSIALREVITSGQHWFRSAIRGPLFRESTIPALAMSKPNCLNHNVTVEFVDIYIYRSLGLPEWQTHRDVGPRNLRKSVGFPE